MCGDFIHRDFHHQSSFNIANFTDWSVSRQWAFKFQVKQLVYMQENILFLTEKKIHLRRKSGWLY